MVSGYTTDYRVVATGVTETNTGILAASKEMYERTKKQAESNSRKLNTLIKNIYYDSNGKLKSHPPYEPKMTNRWIVEFPKEYHIPEWVGKAVTLPTYPFSQGGKITVVLRDPIALSTTSAIMEYLDNPKPFKLKINVLDPVGIKIEKWILKGCLITSIDWSTLDYESNEPTLIYLTISYNEVKYKTK